jgi:phage terminase large subunit
MSSQLAIANDYDVVDIQLTDDFLPLFDQNHPAYKLRNLCWYGGRAAQKSWQIARGLLLRGTQSEELITCTREYQNSIADSVLSLLQNQINILDLNWFYKVQRNSIHGKNGTDFIFKGLRRNIQSVKGIEGTTICWVEEAQVVSQESWEILIPTIRAEGSQIIVSFNPHLSKDPTYTRYVTKPIGDLFIRKVNYDSNPFFPEVLRKEMEWDKKNNFERYLHVWEGKPLERLESLVFKNYRIDGEIKPSNEDFIRQGADFGFRDPSCLLRAWTNESKREIYIDYESYGVEVEINDLPELFCKIPNAKKNKITADSSRPETISYLKNKGFKIDRTKKGGGSVEEGIEFLKSYTIVVHPRCKHLIAELGMYCYKTEKLTGEITNILEDDNNHCIDALRYAFESLCFAKSMVHV